MRAHNAATASDNKIHDDTVARRHGFAGGLVPGITVFGYLTAPVVELWGEAWLERGFLAARFRQPIYDGDDVTVEGSLSDDVIDVEARNSDAAVCGLGQARVAPFLRHGHPGANRGPGPWNPTGRCGTDFGVLARGGGLAVPGRVAELSERRGHQIVDLDLLMVAGGVRAVMHVRHSAIYRL